MFWLLWLFFCGAFPEFCRCVKRIGQLEGLPWMDSLHWGHSQLGVTLLLSVRPGKFVGWGLNHWEPEKGRWLFYSVQFLVGGDLPHFGG
ncbi:hypothetical protein KC19_5G024600 [Ceratodon purpureus]|uniref:Secreted protein n=1 Tax=Ceratodon purpureus TaxID=3225 RepID=A0A8T0HY41_CERPU|nr:hypothetical protein KC19_5G024600 [Ceratodon purpureus]